MDIILGSGGYLGSLLHDSMKNLDRPTVYVSRSFQWQSTSPHHISIETDLKNFSSYSSYINSSSTIVYMAGSTNILQSEHQPINDITHHIVAMEEFFRSLRDFTKLPERLIYFSSGGAIYGDSQGSFKAENSQLLPKSVYGKRNLISEVLFSTNSVHPHE